LLEEGDVAGDVVFCGGGGVDVDLGNVLVGDAAEGSLCDDLPCSWSIEALRLCQ
jgi:hypothetical protein